MAGARKETPMGFVLRRLVCGVRWRGMCWTLTDFRSKDDKKLHFEHLGVANIVDCSTKTTGANGSPELGGGWGWQEVGVHRLEVVLETGAGALLRRSPGQTPGAAERGTRARREYTSSRQQYYPKTGTAFLLIRKLGSN